MRLWCTYEARIYIYIDVDWCPYEARKYIYIDVDWCPYRGSVTDRGCVTCRVCSAGGRRAGYARPASRPPRPPARPRVRS